MPDPQFSLYSARLELADTAILPDVFDLSILHKDTTFPSKLHWRHDGSFGVTFDDQNRKAKAAPAPTALNSATLQRSIIELEAENTTLRTLIAASKSQPAAASLA